MRKSTQSWDETLLGRRTPMAFANPYAIIQALYHTRRLTRP